MLRFVAVLLSAALAVGLAPGVAKADSLDDQRKKVRSQISQTQQKVSDASDTADSATAALASSRQQLATAQAQLAYVQQQLTDARAKEAAAKVALAKAENELAAANAEVDKGQKKVDAQQAVIGQAVRSAYQQQTDLTGLAIVIAGQDATDVANRIQWNTTIFDTTAAQLDELQRLQLQLEAAQQRKDAAEKQATADKESATSLVTTTAALETQAEQTQAAVNALVKKNAANEAAAKSQLAAYQAQLASFQSEDAHVSSLITARINAEKLAEARRVAASQASSSGSGSSSVSSWGLAYPTDVTYVSSPYGTRVDPISGAVSFHSGTDFPADCGSPIMAARSGTVSDEYYQSSYGNRLILNHGNVNGVYLSTAYNHAARYVVSVGQHVQRGQTIGYIGTTGRSTGCHLHFQVYENGSLANPMRFL